MTTPWYYDYWEKGLFPHQQKLCEAVKWTGCDLEGQRLVSPTHLTNVATNPLTLRLRALQKALNRLKDEINSVNEEIRKSVNNHFNKGGGFSWGITLHTQDSHLETGGAAIEEIHLPENKNIIFRYDTVHFALFDFFTNSTSILDRLAFEINLLYQLGDWLKDTLDWPKLTNPNNRFFPCLHAKDQNLAEFIKNQSPNFKKILSYRNRLLHDSIISADMGEVHYGKSCAIFLPGDLQVDNAIEFCEEAKANTLKLLDESYRLMLQHIEIQGKPPW